MALKFLYDIIVTKIIFTKIVPVTNVALPARYTALADTHTMIFCLYSAHALLKFCLYFAYTVESTTASECRKMLSF
jgi:hypothetical protein